MIRFLVIAISFFIALCFSAFPFSSWGIWLNPLWPLLLLLAWNFYLPNSVNVGVAFIMGLLVDSLGGGILGLHALAFIISVMLMNIFRVRLKMFHVLQQSLCIAVLLFINVSIVLLGTLLFDDATVYAASYFSVLTSAVVWPIILWLLAKACSSVASDKKLGWR